MAFKKFKRTFRKSRKSFRKGKGKKSYVKKAIKGALRSRGLDKPEVKHLFQDYASTPISTSLSAAGLSLNPTTSGIGPAQFIGQNYTARGVAVRANIWTEAGVTSSSVVRILIIEDLQPYQGAMVLYNAAAAFGFMAFRTNDIFSQLVDIKDKRYKMLYDKSYTFGAEGSDSSTRVISIYKSLGNASVSMVPNFAGTALNIVNRQYLLFMVSDTGNVSMTLHVDFKYTDV